MKCKYILLSSIFLYDFSTVQTAMAQNDRTPNIIYIMSDDHASQAVSAYGGILSTVLPTPNIDRIAHEGAIEELFCDELNQYPEPWSDYHRTI